MTFGPWQIQNVINIHNGVPAKPGRDWGFWGNKAYDYAIGCHWGHKTDFAAALIAYCLFFQAGWEEQCKTWSLSWVLPVILYNLACEAVFCNTWHWLTYAGPYAQGRLKDHKLNKDNQYLTPDEAKKFKKVGMFWSTNGNLQREIFFTTLGWIQSSMFQCVMMNLWASGKIPHYNEFWSVPAWSLFHLLFVTYFREFHFYWCHRMIHPWFGRNSPYKSLDVGQFLYTNFHSLHHKSNNPGPWSGLSMHPVEHFFYYTCSLLPLFFKAHPLHHLYAKFHADIAPIAGHDGMEFSGGDFHWLHHHRFECNYGVPLIDFDRLFGTWADYGEWKEKKAKKDAKFEKEDSLEQK